MDRSILFWGLVIILGVPALSLVLMELIRFFEQRGSLLTPVLRNLGRYVLPLVAILVVLKQLLKLTAIGLPVKVVETGLGIAAIVTLLALINAILTPNEPKPRSFQLQVPNLFFQAARAGIVLLLLAQVLGNTWQVDLGGIVQALGIGSLVIALALQDTLGNLVSGFLLLFSSPFKVGDWIEVDGSEGRVIDLNWRAVTLRNPSGFIEIIPNGTLAKTKIINHAPVPKPWVGIQIRFSYEDPPNRVISVLETVAKEIENLESPFACVESYDDFAITYSIYFQTLPEKAYGTQVKLRACLYYAAQRHGFTIPYPIGVQYAVDPPQGLSPNIPQVSEHQHLEIVAYLRSLPYLSSLQSTVVETLAQKVTLEYYGAGESIIKAGEPDHGLYILREGSVKLLVKDSQGEDKEVERLSMGNFFGEMALLPGELSPVSVLALEDVKALVIDHNSAQNLIDSSQKFAQEMNQFIEKRKRAVYVAQGSEKVSQQKPKGNDNLNLLSLVGQITKTSDSSITRK